MLERARRGLGKDLVSDPGLGTRQILALLACSVVLTPLVGWVLALWWRAQRPRAAIQSLAVSLPASLMFFIAVILLM
jgi:hypothetical protein